MKRHQVSRRSVLKGTLMASVIGGSGSFFGPWKENRAFAQGPKPIKLGLTCDASGQYGNSGQDDLRGIKMAIEEFNAKGGVLGRKVEWITADTETNPATGTRVAERFIAQEPQHLRSQRRRIAGRHQEPRHTVLDHVGDRPDRGCDHRETEREGLHQNLRDSIPFHRRHHEQVQRPEHVQEIVAEPQDADLPDKAMGDDSLTEGRFFRSFADDHEGHILPPAQNPGSRLDEVFMALVGAQVGNDPHQIMLGRQAQFVSQMAFR